MNDLYNKNEEENVKKKGRKAVDNEDTMNFINSTWESKGEKLQLKHNPYGTKYKNNSSTRRPKIVCVDSSESYDILKRKTIDNVEVASNVQKKIKFVTDFSTNTIKYKNSTRNNVRDDNIPTKFKSSTKTKIGASRGKSYQGQSLDEFLPVSKKSKLNFEHPIMKLGYVIFNMSEKLKKELPNPDVNERYFTPIFNNFKSTNGDISPEDDRKRLHYQVNDTERNKKILVYMDDVCNFVMANIDGLPDISPYLTSILVREKNCEEQFLHRDGDNGYFFIIPITDNYEIGVLPTSHNYPFPEVFEEVKGRTQELPKEMYPFVKISLKKGQVFVGRRNLVHCGGRANNRLYRENKTYCDMSYHAHVVIAKHVDKEEKTECDQIPTFVRFKVVTDKP